MTISLYGTGSSRSFRCLWALHEAKLEHSFVAVNLGSGNGLDAKGTEYLERNPQGKVPTLIHSNDREEFVLTESAAILNYINGLADQQFVPQDLRLRAKYDELCFFVLAELEQPLWTTGKHMFALPEEQRVAGIFATTKFEFQKACGALRKLLSAGALNSGYAVGDTFSFADILLAHTISWANNFKFDVDEELLAYKERMYARAACQNAKAEIT